MIYFSVRLSTQNGCSTPQTRPRKKTQKSGSEQVQSPLRKLTVYPAELQGHALFGDHQHTQANNEFQLPILHVRSATEMTSFVGAHIVTTKNQFSGLARTQVRTCICIVTAVDRDVSTQKGDTHERLFAGSRDFAYRSL